MGSRRAGVATAATGAAVPAGGGGGSVPAGGSGGSVRLAVVAPLQQRSPFGVSWREVLEHTAQRLAWQDPAFRLVLHDASELADASQAAALQADLRACQAAVAVDVADAGAAAALASLLAAVPTAVAVGSAPQLAAATRLGGREPRQPGAAGPLAALLHKLFPDKQATVDEQVGAELQASSLS